MEEFSPELGRAEYIGPFTWFNGVSHLAVRGWFITPCRCKGDGQHLCLSTLTPYLARCYDGFDHVYWSVIPNQ